MIIRYLAFAAMMALLTTGPSLAQVPPASCAGKFVGMWTILVKATGQTYQAQINADGTSHAYCPLCMPVQRWTCEGNTHILIDPFRVDSVLSADGTRTESSCCIGTRVGPPPQIAAPAPCNPGTAQMAQEFLTLAQRFDALARRERNQEYLATAIKDYGEAANLFGRCGDGANQEKALAARDKLQNDLAKAVPPTGPAKERADPTRPGDPSVCFKLRHYPQTGAQHPYRAENGCKFGVKFEVVECGRETGGLVCSTRSGFLSSQSNEFVLYSHSQQAELLRVCNATTNQCYSPSRPR